MDSIPLIGTESSHNYGYIALFGLAVALQFIVILISYEAWFGLLGIFDTSIFDAFKVTDVHFSPVEWSLAVLWTIVFLWQLAWIIHGISAIKRKTSYGYLYISPGHLHPEIYGFISLSLGLVIMWTLLWQFRLPTYSLISLLFAIIAQIPALLISLRRLYIRGPALISEWETRELWFTRYGLQNGLAASLKWFMYIFLMNVGYLFHKNSGVSVDISGTVCLAMVLICTSIVYVVEVFIFDRYCRYIFSHYFIDVIYSLGTISTNWMVQDSSSALSSMLFGLSSVFLASKIGLMVYRHFKYPVIPDDDPKVFPPRHNYGTVEYDESEHLTAEDTA